MVKPSKILKLVLGNHAYNPVVGTAFALMGMAVVMLFVPMIRALDIIEIEIVEDYDS